MIEGVEVNFDGALDNLKVEKDDPARDIVVQKVQENKATKMLELERKLLVYRVSINDNETSKAGKKVTCLMTSLSGVQYETRSI